ncbi:MAG: hypothetical protein RLZZ546_828 [Bacteroidota bacterium]
MSFIVGASSVGTLIEWYDFYIFGMLATIISKQFFPQESGASALLNTLAIFAAGFLVRPFGALVFGRLGDKLGRKHTFLLTLILMGGSTFCIGLVPSFKSIGWWAPILILILRLIQGLALGGEYGGAATYVAEHAPENRRGYWTSWIQTTATIGLFMAIGVILFIRQWQGIESFSSEWGGWRWPFWLSLALVGVSVVIRLKMQESPLFAKVKKEGLTAKNPIKESFGKRENFKMVLLALFGAVMGQGVVWYTGQFYAQSFLENVCKINFAESRNILLVAILLATPFFIFFGKLSDRLGRKWIMLAGMLLAVITYRPIYQTMLNLTQKEKLGVAIKTKVTEMKSPVLTDKSFKLSSVKYDTSYVNGFTISTIKTDTLFVDNKISIKPSIVVEKNTDNATFWYLVILIFFQILYVAMVYGPIAAFLVELFPTNIRYTSMSLPYHIGNGVFGGLVPFISTLIVENSKSSINPSGDTLSGLWYPIGVAALCFVIGLIYLPNKKQNQ